MAKENRSPTFNDTYVRKHEGKPRFDMPTKSECQTEYDKNIQNVQPGRLTTQNIRLIHEVQQSNEECWQSSEDDPDIHKDMLTINSFASVRSRIITKPQTRNRQKGSKFKNKMDTSSNGNFLWLNIFNILFPKTKNGTASLTQRYKSCIISMLQKSKTHLGVCSIA